MIDPTSLTAETQTNQLESFSGLTKWQERILPWVIGGIICIIVPITLLLRNTPTQVDPILSIYASIALIIVLLSLIFLRSLPYLTKTLVTLSLVYIFMNVLFALFSLSLNSLILIIFFVISTSLLLPIHSEKWGAILALITLAFWIAITAANDRSTSMVSLTIPLFLTFFVGLICFLTISSIKKMIFLNNIERENLTNKYSSQVSDLEQKSQTIDDLSKYQKIAAQISEMAINTGSKQELLAQSCEILKNSLNLYYAGFFIVDDLREYANLVYGTGDAGRTMVSNNHKLPVGGYSMIGRSIQTSEAIWSNDVHKEIVHFQNPLLPETNSELSIPLNTAFYPLGAITIQSKDTDFFNSSLLLFFNQISNIVSSALERIKRTDDANTMVEHLQTQLRNSINVSMDSNPHPTGLVEVEFRSTSRKKTTAPGTTVSIPIQMQGTEIGEFILQTENLSAEEKLIATKIADQTSLALGKARLYGALRQQVSTERIIRQLSDRLSGKTSIDELAKTMASEIGSLPSVDEVSISILSPDELLGLTSLNQEEK